MSKKPFRLIQNAPRDQAILQRQIQIMTRQNGDLTAQLAQAEAINSQLISEHQQMHAELTALKATKGRK